VRVYYKATRLDGTDFRTGTIRYAVGETVTHPAAKKVKDDPVTYLSVSTVATDCTGFRWPCRLFTVEGIGRPLLATNLPNKRCFSAVKVIEERPAYEVFGPQGVEVVAVITRAKTLTRAEAKQLGATRAAIRAATWAATQAVWYAVWYAVRDVDAALDAAWETGRDATWNAALAVLTRDLITPEQFDILYGPWREVIGDPT